MIDKLCMFVFVGEMKRKVGRHKTKSKSKYEASYDLKKKKREREEYIGKKENEHNASASVFW